MYCHCIVKQHDYQPLLTSNNLYARGESNPHNQLRRLVFYPLNYGRKYRYYNNKNKLVCQTTLNEV